MRRLELEKKANIRQEKASLIRIHKPRISINDKFIITGLQMRHKNYYQLDAIHKLPKLYVETRSYQKYRQID